MFRINHINGINDIRPHGNNNNNNRKYILFNFFLAQTIEDHQNDFEETVIDTISNLDTRMSRVENRLASMENSLIDIKKSLIAIKNFLRATAGALTVPLTVPAGVPLPEQNN